MKGKGYSRSFDDGVHIVHRLQADVQTCFLKNTLNPPVHTDIYKLMSIPHVRFCLVEVFLLLLSPSRCMASLTVHIKHH